MPSRIAAIEHTCRECGRSYKSLRADGEFCQTKCRSAWNNRRAIRGAELYDLFMALRFERGVATKLGVWKLICRMAWWWKDQDAKERAGRKSYAEPATAVKRAVRYQGIVMQRGTR